MPRQFVVFRYAQAVAVHIAHLIHSVGIAQAHGLLQAAHGGFEILLDALPGEQLFGQQVQRFRVVGIGSLDNPLYGGFGIGSTTDAIEPHVPGLALGSHHAFGGHTFIPMQGFGFVHAAEAAGFIQAGELPLRIAVVLFGGAFEPADTLAHVGFGAQSVQEGIGHMILCLRFAQRGGMRCPGKGFLVLTVSGRVFHQPHDGRREFLCSQVLHHLAGGQYVLLHAFAVGLHQSQAVSGFQVA